MWERWVIKPFFLQDAAAHRRKPLPFKPDPGYSDDMLSRFCEQGDFLAPICLLNGYTAIDHAANAEQTIARMNLLCCDSDQQSILKACPHSFKSTPLVYDTGASYGLTPFRADFIDYQ